MTTSLSTVNYVDADERFRIERGGLDETLFVEAGAGTGKTHELVERVVNLVIAGGVRLSAIAAITFTEAAASELRDRVREALERRLSDGGIGPETEACEQAMVDIDQAAITTLHGFCLRILSEQPLAVELPPRVQILDEVASQVAFHERWNRFVDDLYDDPESEELVLRAWALAIEIDTASAKRTSFKLVARIFDDSWDRLDALCAQTPGRVGPVDVQPLAAAVVALRQMRSDGNTNPSDKLALRIDDILVSAEAVLHETDGERQLQLLMARDKWTSSGLGDKKKWVDVQAARAAANEVGAVADVLVARARDEVLRQLSIRLARFTRDAAERRRAEGNLDFHDLLVLAKRLLRTSPEARAALGARYERLLLDEFQDTDPIQIEVAVLIATAVDGGDGADDARSWSDLQPAPGRLFFVGDPKQSIYRFRRADIRLFLEARNRFAAAGPLRLRQNFRTVEPVLAWVNEAFGRMMPTEIPGTQPAYHALTANRGGKSGSDHRVVLLGGARETNAWDLRTEEADLVAATVATVGTDPAAWPVFDRPTQTWRDPRWSDVTILIPTRTSLRQLEDALDGRNIPYRVATGSLVFDTQEVREALAALRAIDDPGDEIALVSALRSPLYACSDVDLFTYHEAGGRWDLWSRSTDVPVEHPVVRALAHLRSLAETRWWHEPSALLDRLLRERSAFALAYGSRRPREVWRRLRFIVDQARAFEEAGGGGLRSFLDWADLQRAEGTRVHEPLLAETDDDAVSILTIHGAKGLEFPITVVSGATTATASRRGGPKVIWNEGVPEVRLTSVATTENFDRMNDIEAEMDVHERRRLLYVACTRAQDHLVLSMFHKAKAESYGQWLTDVCTEMDDHLVRRVASAGEGGVEASAERGDAAEETPPSVDPVVDDRNGWLAARDVLLAPHREPRFVSATTLAAEAADEVTDDEVTDDEVVTPAIVRRRGRAGTAIGRAVHATLQFVQPGDDDERLVELATQHAHLEAVDDSVDTVVALARSARASPCVRAAAAAERSWRELYVSASLGARAVEGYVDLLYEGPGGLVLVDYKTDAIVGPAEADAKVERYAPQIAAYALALEASTGLDVTEARLVFCRADGAAAIERIVPDLEAAKERIRNLLV